MYDVIIIGGGPAGLSAALILGRCRRKVLLCDEGRQRNLASQGLHGYLTRDGILPAEFLTIGCDELGAYPGVELRQVAVTDARGKDGEFDVALSDGSRHRSKKLLLATGVVDLLPEIDGWHELYGKSIHHCPYCDGWERRDEPIAVYGHGEGGPGLASKLMGWTRDIVLCTDGHDDLEREDEKRLEASGIPIRCEKIVRLEGHDGLLERIHFAEGPPLARKAIFFTTGQRQHSDLAERIGCKRSKKGSIEAGEREETCVPGVYVVGDATKDTQLVIIAAAEGANAAFDINSALLKDEFGA